MGPGGLQAEMESRPVERHQVLFEFRWLSGEVICHKPLPEHRECRLLRRIALDSGALKYTDEFDMVVDGAFVRDEDTRTIVEVLGEGRGQVVAYVVRRRNREFEWGRTDACSAVLEEIAVITAASSMAGSSMASSSMTGAVGHHHCLFNGPLQ